MLLCGTSDKDRKFHPSGLALTTDEKTGDFRFLFASLKEGVIETQPDWGESADSQRARTCFDLSYEKF